MKRQGHQGKENEKKAVFDHGMEKDSGLSGVYTWGQRGIMRPSGNSRSRPFNAVQACFPHGAVKPDRKNDVSCDFSPPPPGTTRGSSKYFIATKID
jgi:hypothetical protein